MSLSFPPTDDPLLVRSLDVATAAWHRQDFSQAYHLLQLALRRAETRHDTGGMLSTHQLLAHVAFDAGDLDNAQVHHQLVLERCRRLRLQLGIASAMHNLGLVAAARSNQPEARKLINEAIMRYEALGHESGATTARANLERLIKHWQRSSNLTAEGD